MPHLSDPGFSFVWISKMQIQLTRGMVAVIDDEDFDLVRGFRWTAHNASGVCYAAARIKTEGGKYKLVLMHRLILDAPEDCVVDHKDSDTLNNRRSNIRLCSHSENMRNSKLRSTSTTGVRNVMIERWYKNEFRYRATIRVDGIRHRRWFTSLEDAGKWANETRESLHGEFAYKKTMDSRMN